MLKPSVAACAVLRQSILTLGSIRRYTPFRYLRHPEGSTFRVWRRVPCVRSHAYRSRAVHYSAPLLGCFHSGPVMPGGKFVDCLISFLVAHDGFHIFARLRERNRLHKLVHPAVRPRGLPVGDAVVARIV